MDSFGAAELTDGIVRAAAAGSQSDLGRVLEKLAPQVRVMVAARLSPTPAQYHAAEDISQQVMTALTTGLGRLEHRTVGGLRAFVSGVVRNQVAEAIRRWQREGGPGARVGSIESNIGRVTQSTPLWQLLSASLTSPRSAVDRAEQSERVMSELGRLKPSYREVIALAFFDQLSTGQIANAMHSTREAVSMLLLRAVRTLQRRLNVPAGEHHGAPA